MRILDQVVGWIGMGIMFIVLSPMLLIAVIMGMEVETEDVCCS